MPVSGVGVSISPRPAAVTRVSVVTDGGQKLVEQDVTDTTGAFQLELDQRPASLTLRFEGAAFESSVEVTNIPGSAAQVTVGLVFDDETQTVSSESERFEDEEGNEILENVNGDSFGDGDAERGLSS